MASLVGSWQFVGADNLDGYMQAAGKNILNFNIFPLQQQRIVFFTIRS